MTEGSKTLPITVDVPEVAGLELIAGVLCYRGIAVQAMRAWPVALAARLCGMGRKAFRADIANGDLKLSRHDLISAVELERYLAARPV